MERSNNGKPGNAHIATGSKEFEASSRRWPSADPTTNGEAHVTRQVGVRSYEVESDGKSCIGNWKQLKKAANDAKSSHGIEDYAAAYRDLPINKPHQEEPTQHKEPNASSKTTAITKQQSLTDCQTQEHVPKTRSGRNSVPPTRFKDFVRFCWGKFFSFCFSFSHLLVIVYSFTFRSPVFC